MTLSKLNFDVTVMSGLWLGVIGNLECKSEVGYTSRAAITGQFSTRLAYRVPGYLQVMEVFLCPCSYNTCKFLRKQETICNGKA